MEPGTKWPLERDRWQHTGNEGCRVSCEQTAEKPGTLGQALYPPDGAPSQAAAPGPACNNLSINALKKEEPPL